MLTLLLIWHTFYLIWWLKLLVINSTMANTFGCQFHKRFFCILFTYHVDFVIKCFLYKYICWYLISFLLLIWFYVGTFNTCQNRATKSLGSLSFSGCLYINIYIRGLVSKSNKIDYIKNRRRSIQKDLVDKWIVKLKI